MLIWLSWGNATAPALAVKLSLAGGPPVFSSFLSSLPATSTGALPEGFAFPIWQDMQSTVCLYFSLISRVIKISRTDDLCAGLSAFVRSPATWQYSQLTPSALL